MITVRLKVYEKKKELRNKHQHITQNTNIQWHNNNSSVFCDVAGDGDAASYQMTLTTCCCYQGGGDGDVATGSDAVRCLDLPGRSALYCFHPQPLRHKHRPVRLQVSRPPHYQSIVHLASGPSNKITSGSTGLTGGGE